MSDHVAIEAAVARTVLWVVPAAAIFSAAGLVVSAPAATDLSALMIRHLAAIVVLGLALAKDLSRYLPRPWFVWLSPTSRHLASGASVVALTTGAVALVTLASSAALRFQPSAQFLQLLSAMDIAWVTAAVLIGVTWLAGRRAGMLAAAMVAVVCVWSIWSYLGAVGFSPDGGWVVDRAALMRYVLPFDVVAAVIAVSTLVLGARKRGAAMQPAHP
ncbi:MAG: hypothetical protein R6W79_07985 [Acidimicrobiia bacterium]